MFAQLFKFATANRAKIIQLFQLSYVGLMAFILIAAWQIFTDGSWVNQIYSLGDLLGEASVITFLVVTVPGMIGRFGVKHQLITIGIMFRRYMGILMFLLAMCHGLIVYELPAIATKSPLFEYPLYVLFGAISLSFAFPLFLTSNNWSMQKLGKNWKRLHKLVYIMYWTILLHVALQQELKYTLLVGALAVLELVSLYVDWRRQKPTLVQSAPPGQTPAANTPPSTL